MRERRSEPRHMCADLLKVRLPDEADPKEFIASGDTGGAPCEDASPRTEGGNR